MVPEAILRAQLDRTLVDTNFPSLGSKYEGKVRDNYSRDGVRLIVATDRISAFDRVLGTVPFKGQVLTQLAAFWFGLTAGVVKSHFVRLRDPNVVECIECSPLPVEMVVRAYITGSTTTSMWTHYSEGRGRFAGHEMPEGLKRNQKLERTIITPSTKAEKGGSDVSVSRDALIGTGVVSADDFDRAAALAMLLFHAGEEHCRSKGLILVDTKYEFGKTRDGEIVVIDEIHTPDSSRFWTESTYTERFAAGLDPEPLDKDFVRRYFVALGYRGQGDPPPLPSDVRVGPRSGTSAPLSELPERRSCLNWKCLRRALHVTSGLHKRRRL